MIGDTDLPVVFNHLHGERVGVVGLALSNTVGDDLDHHVAAVEALGDGEGVGGFLAGQLHGIGGVGHEVGEVVSVFLHERFAAEEQLHVHGIIVHSYFLEVLETELHLTVLNFELVAGLGTRELILFLVPIILVHQHGFFAFDFIELRKGGGE